MERHRHGQGRAAPGGDDGLILREPVAGDGGALRELVSRLDILAENSAFAYVLVGWHLADTSCVAEVAGDVRGFVSGLRPPRRPDVLFVWQVGVDPSLRGGGVGRRMILEILARTACDEVRWLETIVSAANEPSRRLFRSCARELDTELEIDTALARDRLPSGFENEQLLRIGPLARREGAPRTAPRHRFSRE